MPKIIIKEEKSIRDRLLDSRTIFLEGIIYEDCISPSYQSVRPRALRDILFWLDSQNHKPIKLIINSPGGLISEGVAVIDVMDTIKSPVWTVCISQAASMAAIILACGQKGHRYIFPSATVMLHLAESGYRGNPDEIKNYAEYFERVMKRILTKLAKATGKSEEEIKKDIQSEKWMDGEQALKYGLVDRIITSKIYEELKLLNEKVKKNKESEK